MTSEKSATALLVETCAQFPQFTVMSGLLFWLPVAKMSWEKNCRKKPILLVNFCFLIHFDFSNTRIFSFSVGSKVMNPKMPLCMLCKVLKVDKQYRFFLRIFSQLILSTGSQNRSPDIIVYYGIWAHVSTKRAVALFSDVVQTS